MLIRAAIGVLLAGLGIAWYLTLPPRQEWVERPPPDGIRGAIHVHTNRSDGTGTVDEVAAAARRAGLDFVILTDHGDGTREPDPPQYREGVLCIDAVEISTRDGHVLALGLPEAPYPLGGEARDVVEDITRFGGFAVAAHPGSAKPELRWRDWDVPVAALEWINGDSEWREESGWSLARALLAYPARRIEALTSLLDRPGDVLERWDDLTRSRKVAAVAGADAHARLGFRSVGEPYGDAPSLHLPPYEDVLRVFSNVLPQLSMTGDADADADMVLSAIRDGRLYSVVDGIGGPAALTFTASDAQTQVHAGGDSDLAEPMAVVVEVPGAANARIDLLKNGERVASASGPRLEYLIGIDAPGAYRTEVSLPGAPGTPPVPWIVSNPIYLGLPPGAHPPPRPAASAAAVQYDGGPAGRWSIETSPASLAALDVVPAASGTGLALRYAIGGAALDSPFVAFALSAGADLADHDRLTFSARADRPMRLSFQLREPTGGAGERWQRSVYIDTTPREITVFFDDLRPVEETTAARATLSRIDSILFVIDTVNTPLGGNGRIWIDDVKYAK